MHLFSLQKKHFGPIDYNFIFNRIAKIFLIKKISDARDY